MSDEFITLSQDAIVMGFVASSIEKLARLRNLSYQTVVQEIIRKDAFQKHFLYNYDTLHKTRINWITHLREHNKLIDIIDTPEVKDIIMSGKIGCIADEISKMLDIPAIDALMQFYQSDTCRRLHDRNTGLYYFSEGYIAEDFVAEFKGHLNCAVNDPIPE